MADNTNKEQADRCLEIGRRYLQNGHYDKAIKLFEKGDRMCPSGMAKVLIERAKKEKAKAESAGSSNTASNTASTSRRTSSSTSSTTSSPTPTKTYKPEHLEIVRKVKSAGKDYYKVLGVAKDASDDDLKKSYRKMALKLHPDKNQAPGADEAFKTVGAAYACLSNGDKRAAYDRYGTDDVNELRRSHGYHGADFQEVSPEDIFNMFFGTGGMGGGMHGRTYTYNMGGNRRQQGQQQQNGNGMSLLNLMPLLLLFVFSFLSGSGNETKLYKLSAAGEYIYERETQSGIHYFVKNSFENEYGKNMNKILQIERRVEQDYLNYVSQKCQQEQYKQQQMMQEAKWYRGEQREKLVSKAKKYKKPNCKELQERGYELPYYY